MLDDNRECVCDSDSVANGVSLLVAVRFSVEFAVGHRFEFSDLVKFSIANTFELIFVDCVWLAVNVHDGNFVRLFLFDSDGELVFNDHTFAVAIWIVYGLRVADSIAIVLHHRIWDCDGV